MTDWFTADEHYGHGNILVYEKRPFQNIDIMKKALIENHNSVVKEKDEVYHIGDFSMLGSEKIEYLSSIINKLNGIHHLILGSHDRIKPFTYVRMGFASVHTGLLLPNTGRKIILAHDPAVYIMFDTETVLLCGHVHSVFSDLLPEKKIINVGVDVRNFMPISYEEVTEILKEKEK